MIAAGLERVPAHDRPGMIGRVHRRVQLYVVEKAEGEPLLAELGPGIGIGAVAAILMPGALREITLVEDPGRDERSVPILHQAFEIERLALADVLLSQDRAALAPDAAHALANQLLAGGVPGPDHLPRNEHVERAGIARGTTHQRQRAGGLREDIADRGPHLLRAGPSGWLSRVTH